MSTEASLAWKRRSHEARMAAARAQCAYPPPRVPATQTDVGEGYVPRGVRTAAKMLDEHGWRWRLTRAVGPRINARGEVLEAQCASLCIAAVGNRRRILYSWRFDTAKQSWKFEYALISGEGVATSTRAAQVVKEGS